MIKGKNELLFLENLNTINQKYCEKKNKFYLIKVDERNEDTLSGIKFVKIEDDLDIKENNSYTNLDPAKLKVLAASSEVNQDADEHEEMRQK